MAGEDQEALIERIQAVKKAREAELLAKANVIGVGVGLRRRGGELLDEPALVVLVSQKVPRAQLAEQDFIPNQIDGVPVDVQEIGFIRSQATAFKPSEPG
jgi:hypothetical protein